MTFRNIAFHSRAVYLLSDTNVQSFYLTVQVAMLAIGYYITEVQDRAGKKKATFVVCTL